MSNKDQVKGRIRTVKGRFKEAVGRLVGNKNLESEGRIDQATGKIQTKYGDMKREAMENLRNLEAQ